MMTMAWQIDRRAYGEYRIVEVFIGTFTQAYCHAMDLQAANRDGEYFANEVGFPVRGPNRNDPVQDAFAYL